jgi:hypothetical protein
VSALNVGKCLGISALAKKVCGTNTARKRSSLLTYFSLFASYNSHGSVSIRRRRLALLGIHLRNTGMWIKFVRKFAKML